ncbi:hypothetical protein JL721_11683 [Aureococcus anophagefferens]|nr:hypothetical protein JL721_11683 [Aureococcus anophagefferens]
MLRARVVAFAATVAVAQYANLEKYAAFDTTHGVASSEGLSLRLGASSAVGGALLHGDEAWERRLEFGAPSVVYDTDRYKLWYGACVAGRCGSRDATRALLYAESADGVRWRKPRLGLVHWPVGGASAANNPSSWAPAARASSRTRTREPSSRAVQGRGPSRRWRGAAARRARVARRPRLGAAPPRHGRRVADGPASAFWAAALGRYVSFAARGGGNGTVGRREQRGWAGRAGAATTALRGAAALAAFPFYSAYLGFAAARGRCEPYWSPDTSGGSRSSTRGPAGGTSCRRGTASCAGGPSSPGGARRSTISKARATRRSARPPTGPTRSRASARASARARCGRARCPAAASRPRSPSPSAAPGPSRPRSWTSAATPLATRWPKSSPILADAADATLAWSATATRVPELPESCVLVLELADATVFTFGFPRPPPPPRPRDAAERHFAEALLVGEAELLGIARLFGLLGATTLACAGLRGACARVANCVHRDRRKARAADLGLEPRDQLTPVGFFPRVRQGARRANGGRRSLTRQAAARRRGAAERPERRAGAAPRGLPRRGCARPPGESPDARRPWSRMVKLLRLLVALAAAAAVAGDAAAADVELEVVDATTVGSLEATAEQLAALLKEKESLVDSLYSELQRSTTETTEASDKDGDEAPSESGEKRKRKKTRPPTGADGDPCSTSTLTTRGAEPAPAPKEEPEAYEAPKEPEAPAEPELAALACAWVDAACVDAEDAGGRGAATCDAAAEFPTSTDDRTDDAPAAPAAPGDDATDEPPADEPPADEPPAYEPPARRLLDDPLPAEDDEVADDAPRPSPARSARLGELTASDDDGPVSDAKKAAPLILGLLVLAVGFAAKKCCGCVAGLRGGSAPAQPYEKVPQVEMTARDVEKGTNLPPAARTVGAPRDDPPVADGDDDDDDAFGDDDGWGDAAPAPPPPPRRIGAGAPRREALSSRRREARPRPQDKAAAAEPAPAGLAPITQLGAPKAERPPPKPKPPPPPPADDPFAAMGMDSPPKFGVGGRGVAAPKKPAAAPRPPRPAPAASRPAPVPAPKPVPAPPARRWTSRTRAPGTTTTSTTS